jgi:hypothetical protein
MFYQIFKVPISKTPRNKNVENKVRCAKPTIRKKNTVNILSTEGKEINLDIFDLKYLDMQNGNKFIRGKVQE